MTPELILDLTKSGYAMILIGGLVFLVIFGKRLWFDGPIQKIALVLGTLLWVIVQDLVTRIGWFSVSRAFPTEGYIPTPSPQNQWMWENKYLMAQWTGWVALIAFMLSAHVIRKFTPVEFVITIGLVALGVAALTVLG